MFVTVQHYGSYYRSKVNNGLRSSLYSPTHCGGTAPCACVVVNVRTIVLAVWVRGHPAHLNLSMQCVTYQFLLLPYSLGSIFVWVVNIVTAHHIQQFFLWGAWRFDSICKAVIYDASCVTLEKVGWVWGSCSVTLVSTESDNSCNALSQKKICGLWLMTNWNSSSHCPACLPACLPSSKTVWLDDAWCYFQKCPSVIQSN